MANNVHTLSLPPPSENDSIGDNFDEFVGLDVLPHPSNEQMQPQPTLVALDKKPKGRPPGSKNKPKSPILQEKKEFVKPIVFTISAGMDIVNAIIDFGRNHDVTILVNNASGFISEVNLFNYGSPSDDLSFRGNLHMLSLSGFYTNKLSPSPPKNIPHSSFTIQFSRGCDFQLFGGLVRDKLIAAGPVQVMATITKKHKYCNPLLSLSAIPNNTTNQLGFSVGPSTSLSTNIQPPVASTTPINVSMLYWNNLTK